ncbi:hypothetical protein VNO77_19063 [Canavalia gladiata]|uniref:Uncharacterized protein n=1 Tax=Canavalia gladiata TaxID=3824 RepID=A0AAN9LRW2_CANGL
MVVGHLKDSIEVVVLNAERANIYMGDLVHHSGRAFESRYVGILHDENSEIIHSHASIVSIVNSEPSSNGSDSLYHKEDQLINWWRLGKDELHCLIIRKLQQRQRWTITHFRVTDSVYALIRKGFTTGSRNHLGAFNMGKYGAYACLLPKLSRCRC